MSLTFPLGRPNRGDNFVGSNDIQYTFDGDKWISIGTVGATGPGDFSNPQNIQSPTNNNGGSYS